MAFTRLLLQATSRQWMNLASCASKTGEGKRCRHACMQGMHGMHKTTLAAA
jgi:hypothetical protein